MYQKSIGILALQGDFAEHAEILERLGVETQLVRQPGDLENCAGLIMPGGESTSMLKLLEQSDLLEPLRCFVQAKPVLATCAGLILLAKEINPRQFSYQVLDVAVERNAYGSQLDSFVDTITLAGGGEIEGVFIRAPQITRILSGQVTVIARHGDQPVGVQAGNLIGLTFHPELTGETWFHEALIEQV